MAKLILHNLANTTELIIPRASFQTPDEPGENVFSKDFPIGHGLDTGWSEALRY